MFTSGPFDFTNSKSPSERYGNSEAVRDWLVHTALATDNQPLAPHIRKSHLAAFERVCAGVRQGLIELDYHPANKNIVDIPAINHPYYMQAMLYWCVQFGCNLSLLSEAHAQLGKLAPAENVRSKVKLLKAEENKPPPPLYGWIRTQGHSGGAFATLPMSRPPDPI